jgi:hypothetical protein
VPARRAASPVHAVIVAAASPGARPAAPWLMTVGEDGESDGPVADRRRWQHFAMR